MEKPILNIVGTDGNAFAILGAANKVARKAGWSAEKITEFKKEAMSGDYDNLLSVCAKYFDCE